MNEPSFVNWIVNLSWILLWIIRRWKMKKSSIQKTDIMNCQTQGYCAFRYEYYCSPNGHTKICCGGDDGCFWLSGSWDNKIKRHALYYKELILLLSVS